MPMTLTQRPLRQRLSLREHSLMSEGTRALGAASPAQAMLRPSSGAQTEFFPTGQREQQNEQHQCNKALGMGLVWMRAWCWNEPLLDELDTLIMEAQKDLGGRDLKDHP